MRPRDIILGNVCVERGWLSSLELVDCLGECATLAENQLSAGSISPLAQVLIRRRLIPAEELEVITAEISSFLRRGSDSAADRDEDITLGRFLRDAGKLPQKLLEEAIASEKDSGGRNGAPRLREILLEKGFVTLSALRDAFQALKAPGTSMSCRSCKASSVVPGFDPGRVYLCKVCTGELVPTSDLEAGCLPQATPDQGQTVHESGKHDSPVEIGRGGMGVVYKAWDDDHQRWVALKVVKETGRLEDHARFRREIEIARSLHHPNIVPLYEVTHVGDEYRIAMEYVDGKTLADLRLPLKWAAELIALIAHALQYAHSRGIIHRDIKPQNIMIDRTGKPYLMDFGLAKSTSNSSSITSVGTAMGTPSYMAPEQAIGRTSRVDRRSDIYSLGAVLYDLVTGSPPFRGANPLDTIRRVVDEPLIPPAQIDSSIPKDFEGIILRCMEKDKNSRYQTARHLADDLERFISSFAT